MLFGFHQWVFGLAACFYRQTRVGDAGRREGRLDGGVSGGAGFWIWLHEPTGSRASADSDWASASAASLGEKVPSACPL